MNVFSDIVFFRSLMAMGVRKAFEKVFGKSAHTLGMSVVYDVSHNIAKEEEHTVAGKKMRVLVHRKGTVIAICNENVETEISSN